MEKYTIKQILFGLRNEYIRNQQKLQRLKDAIDGNNIDYSIYYDIDYKKEIFSLICSIKSQKNIIQKLLSLLNAPEINEYSFKTRNLKTYRIRFEENNHPTNLIGYKENRIMILNDRIRDIFDSDFIKHMNVEIIYLQDKKCDLMITPNNISTGIYEGSNIPPSSIFYRPIKDEIELLSFYDYFLIDDFNKIMDIQIPSENLNSFIITTIKNHDVKDKEIIIDGLKQVREKQNFKIVEHEKTIKLTK